jgi:hypothetical protein
LQYLKFKIASAGGSSSTSPAIINVLSEILLLW